MFKTLFIYILLFSSKVWNLFFIGLCFIPFRTFIYLEKYILVKNLWKFFNKFLIKKSQIIQFYLFLQYIFNFIYLLIIIFCFTIFIYLFILLLLEQFFFISSMFACNRLLLFFFIYFFSYLLFCGDDDFFNNFFELNFVDFRKDLHEKGEEWLFYFNEYHDLLDNEVDDFFTEYEWDFEESEFTSSAAEEEFITVEDTSNTNITYQDSILNDNLEYLDNLYFFERWLNLSTEVLDRIYYARYLLRIKDSIVKKKTELFIKNKNFYNELQREYLIIFEYFTITSLYLHKSHVFFKYIKNFFLLKKQFINTHEIFQDDVSFYIKYFKLQLDSKKKFRGLTFWGKSELSSLSIKNFKTISNYKFLKEKNFNVSTNLNKIFLTTKFTRSLQFWWSIFLINGRSDSGIAMERSLTLFNKYWQKPLNSFQLIKINKFKKSINNFKFFNFNLFYLFQLKNFYLKYQTMIIITDEEKEFLSTILLFNDLHWYNILPEQLVNELLIKIFERHFRIILKAFFDQNIINNYTILEKYKLLFLNNYISKNFYIKYFSEYKNILYKILAKIWKNNKVTKYQIDLLNLINQYSLYNFYDLNIILPADNKLFDLLAFKKMKIFNKNFQQRFLSKFLFFKSFNNRTSIKIFSNRLAPERYINLFALSDPLAAQFFINRFKKKIILVNENKIVWKDYSRNNSYLNFIPLKFFYGIENLVYFLFEFLPQIITSNLKLINLKFIYGRQLYRHLYQYYLKYNLIQEVPQDFFFFPFFNLNLRIVNEESGFLTLVKNRLETSFNMDFITEYVFINKLILKKLNILNFLKFNIDFLCVLKILNLTTLTFYKNYKSFFNYIFCYNIAVYKNLFLKNLLKTISFKINNLKDFKKNLTGYYYSFFFSFFNKSTYFFKLETNLNLHDFNILNALFNRYWGFGFRGLISTYNLKAQKKINSGGYLFLDPIEGGTINDALLISKDFFPTNWTFYLSTLSLIEKWLQQKHIDDEDNIDDEDYHLIWVFFFFFWFFCRWSRFFQKTSDAADRLDDLTAYELYTDSYKLYFQEAIALGVNTFLGSNYVGDNRGYPTHNYLREVWRDLFIVTPQIVGLHPANKRAYAADLTDTIYTLNEFRIEYDEASGLVHDFFRYNIDQDELIENRLQWLLYGNLKRSLILNLKTSLNDFNLMVSEARGKQNFGPTLDIFTHVVSEEFVPDSEQYATNLLRFNKKFYSNIIQNNLFKRQHDYSYLSLKYFYLFETQIKELLSLREERVLSLIKKAQQESNINFYRDWLKLKSYEEIPEDLEFKNKSLEEKYFLFFEFVETFNNLVRPAQRTNEQMEIFREFKPQEWEQEFMHNEIIIADYGRTLRRYYLYIAQGFFYETFFKKGDYRNSLHLLNSRLDYNLTLEFFINNLVGSILRNVTQYREELNDRYSDSIYYLPQYINIVFNLPRWLKAEVLKNNPEYYRLLIKTLLPFSEEPLLNNTSIIFTKNLNNNVERPVWHYLLYQNPYFLTEEKANLVTKFVKATFESNLVLLNYAWNFFFINDLVEELEGLVNALFDPTEYYSTALLDLDDDEVLQIPAHLNWNFEVSRANTLKLWDRMLNTSFTDYNYLMKLPKKRRLRAFEFLGNRLSLMYSSLFHVLALSRRQPTLLKDFGKQLKNSEPIKNKFFSIPDGYKRQKINEQPIREYFSDSWYSKKIVKARDPDELQITIYNFFKVSSFSELWLHIQLLNSQLFFNSSLEKPYKGVRIPINRREREVNFDTGYFLSQDAVENGLKPNFRNFRKKTYKRLKGEFLFNKARAYIENLHEHSNSLYESTPNYLHSSTPYENMDLASFESEVIDQWYEPMEFLSFDGYARLYTGVAIWPWLVRTIFRFPDGEPPLYLVDLNGLPTATNYIQKNHQIYYPDRYRHPIDADEPLEANFHFLEEGTIARFWMYPILSQMFDFSLIFFKKFVFLFENTRIFNFLKTHNGLGDFYYRPLVFRDGFLQSVNSLNSFSQQNLLNRYEKKYFNNLFLMQNELPFLYNKLLLHRQILPPILRDLEINFFLWYSIFCFDLKNSFNWLTKIDLWRNSLLFSDRYVFFGFIFFWITLYYTCWLPILYLISILRNWIDYPNEPDVSSGVATDDNEDEEFLEKTILPRDNIYMKEDLDIIPEGLFEDSGILFSSAGQDISFDLTEHILNFYLAREYSSIDIFAFNNLNYISQPSLTYYMESLTTMIRNELLFLIDIRIPGNNFNYNFLDIFALTQAEFRLSAFQAPLPQHRMHFYEFLTVLTGYKKSTFEDYQEYVLNRDEMFNYFIDQNYNIQKDLKQRKELLSDNIILAKHQTEILNRNTNFNYTKYVSSDLVDKNILQFNNLPNTVWYANKLFFDGLDLLKIMPDILCSNSFWEIILYTEKKNNTLINCLDIFFNLSNLFFLSKNKLLPLQYRPGEKILPFYLRFFRQHCELQELNYLNELISKNINFCQQVQKHTNLLEFLTPHDLLMIIPENKEGLFDLELGIYVLLNLRNYFENRLLNENYDNLSEILLDFHTLETDKWYSDELVLGFKDERGDFLDWLRTIEETKEWLLFLDEERFININVDQVIFSYENQSLVLTDLEFFNFKSYDSIFEQGYLYFRQMRHMQNKSAYTSRQYIIPTDMYARYLEEPLFPDRELYFSTILLNNNSRQIFAQRTVWQNLFITKKIKPSISFDTLSHGITLQLIDLSIYHDINLLFLPLHRTINKTLSLQSSLQLYTYTNLYLNIKRNKNLKNNFMSQLVQKKIFKKKINHNKFIYYGLFFFIFNLQFVWWLLYL